MEKDLKIVVNTTFVEVYKSEEKKPSDSEEEEDGLEPEKKVQEIRYTIDMSTDYEEDLILHWGVGIKNAKEWVAPPVEIYPENTKKFDTKAVQTKFTEGKIQISLTIYDPIENTTQAIYKGLNFVINNPKTNKWYNNGGKDFSIPFKQIGKQTVHKTGEIPDFINDIITCEVEYGSWTLMHRYNKCFDIINGLDISKDHDSLIWIYIWLRYSYTRHLDWQRNYNTKPRELSHSMSRLTGDISYKFCSLLQQKNSENDTFQLSSDILFRMDLSLLGKGTGDGQKIRDEILQILHKHHIKETNDHFYEQWHQKLHNNTTPDDIVICSAVIEYLKSGGNMSVYWKFLNDKGVTKERLAGFERRIVSEPFYKPELIPDLEHFLQTIKAVHSNDDLHLMFESAKYAFNSNDYQVFDEIVRNKDHWDSLKQIYRVTDGRDLLWKIILGNLKDSNKVRDLLFFDVCLEGYLRQLVEKIIHINLDFGHYVSEITAIAKNLNLTYKFKELRLCLEDWMNIGENLKNNLNGQGNNSVYSALKIKSVADRLSRTLTHVIDYFNVNYDPKARYLGNAFNVDKHAVDIFTEETIRGSIFFTLSMILRKIEPTLRKTANLGNWLVISRGKSDEPYFKGTVGYVKSLLDVQFKTFEKKTILLTEQVGGNEEIPENISSVIIICSRDYPDILSHVSVRARNLGVPLLICFEDSISDTLKNLETKIAMGKINGQNVEVVEFTQTPTSEDEKKTESEIRPHKIQSVKIPDGFPNIIIHMEDFSKEHVGAKSNNTKKVFGNLPSWVKYPESVAIPFNVCEYFLDMDENAKIKESLENLTKTIKSEKGKKISKLLSNCKKVIMGLKFVENEETAKLKSELVKFGLKESDFDSAWNSIKGVWASKYNERAFIATEKVGIGLDDIRMAVLVQKIIPADFAYVIHTKNPSTNDENEVYAEVVAGMGETLVGGTVEGQSFSFTFNKSKIKY